MYDIRQFRPMLYTLLIIGFTGYAIAAESVGYWVLAVGGTLLNAYLVRSGQFKPLPRFVANLITLLFAGWMLVRVKSQYGGSAIFAIGEFLIFLQLVKLFEQRGNRDIAQLLVLSLLLMIAAAISTAGLGFGLLFIGYLFLSLYCCLLFHLKAESDHARSVMGLDESKLNPMTLRQDQRFLSRSMRRLTTTVSLFAVAVAVLVFLAFPRGTGAGMIGSLAFKPQEALTGYSEKVNFQDIARITQNEAEVAYVKITHDGQPWGGPGQVIYLRGNAPDTYISDPTNVSERWQWTRMSQIQPDVVTADQAFGPSANDDSYQQDVRLLPTGSRTLFAMPGVQSFRSARPMSVTRGINDDVLMVAGDNLTSEVNYTVTSTNADAIPYHEPSQSSGLPMDDHRRDYPVPEAVRQFALQDDVAGTDAAGNLAQRKLKQTDVSDLDEKLATNFEAYLKKNFKYTLDLTDVSKVNGSQDPLVRFLTEFKRGHCEYFAGSMALMCQSLGMKARVVVGFKCDEYNSLGNYYVVRQSHAHAWTEVRTLNGWQRFDPTSANEAGVTQRGPTLWQKMRSVMSFLEYKWGNAVVNYSSDDRQNLIANTGNSLDNTAVSSSQWLQDLQKWLNDRNNFFPVFSGVLASLVLLLVLIVIGVLMYFAYERVRLHRRAKRIGLAALPNEQQRRLAKQLGFYDDMLKVLERHRVTRAAHLTPREFGASVGFLPADVFDAVQRLTRIFYRVRYGEADLQPAQRRRLVRSVERMDAALGPTG